MSLIIVNENNNHINGNHNNVKITEDKIMQNFNDCIAAEPNWSKV